MSVNERASIDIHTHVVPEKFPAYAGSHRNVPWPSMVPAQACHAHVMIEGKNYRTVHQSCWLAEDRLADMDRLSIGMQCLSPMPELLSYWLPADDAQILIRHVNDTIADLVARFPKRFCGLGGVPLQDVDLAISELEYLRKQLGFPGVELASHVNGVSIGDPRFEAFFDAAEKMKAAIFVHALRPAGQERIVGPASEQAVCFPGDIGLAVASMITGGMAERHPDLRMAFSHGGGVTPLLMPRLDRAWEIMPALRDLLPQKPYAYARRFFYDTILFDPASLRHIIAAFGESQILLGSDYPFTMGEPDPVRFLERSRLEPGVLDALKAKNAQRFLLL